MKNQAAAEVGRKGLARKRNLTPEQLRAIGKRAAAVRWKNKKKRERNEQEG
jgi:hypothetical protein